MTLTKVYLTNDGKLQTTLYKDITNTNNYLHYKSLDPQNLKKQITIFSSTENQKNLLLCRRIYEEMSTKNSFLGKGLQGPYNREAG